MEIKDVVFDMYRDRVTQIVHFNVQENVSRVLTMVHMMIVDEAQRVPQDQQQPFINILNNMQKTFLNNSSSEEKFETEIPEVMEEKIIEEVDPNSTSKVLSGNFGKPKI